MITINIPCFVIILVCVFLLGFLINMFILEFINRIDEYEHDKELILDYISKHKVGNDLPKKLIYAYLTEEEKQNILKICKEKR